LNDTPEEAAKKVMSAATDSVGEVNLDWENQPGISNLLQIMALFQHRSVEEVASEWQGTTQYGEFKQAVADTVKNFLIALQERLAQVDDATIQNKLESSEEVMREQAGTTLLRVQKAVGLRA
jgi:tryptophanyl-tRNA synthetase